MPNRRTLLRRLKLRHVLLVVLLLSGIIPLAISSVQVSVEVVALNVPVQAGAVFVPPTRLVPWQ